MQAGVFAICHDDKRIDIEIYKDSYGRRSQIDFGLNEQIMNVV
jgi:hypothetical protein